MVSGTADRIVLRAAGSRAPGSTASPGRAASEVGWNYPEGRWTVPTPPADGPGVIGPIGLPRVAHQAYRVSSQGLSYRRDCQRHDPSRQSQASAMTAASRIAGAR